MTIRLFERNRTFTFIVMYSLYLYFLGLSLRNTSNALEPFKDQKRSHVALWNWIQRFGSYHIYKRKRVSAFIRDETIIQIGDENFYILPNYWIGFKSKGNSIELRIENGFRNLLKGYSFLFIAVLLSSLSFFSNKDF